MPWSAGVSAPRVSNVNGAAVIGDGGRNPETAPAGAGCRIEAADTGVPAASASETTAPAFATRNMRPFKLARLGELVSSKTIVISPRAGSTRKAPGTSLLGRAGRQVPAAPSKYSSAGREDDV